MNCFSNLCPTWTVCSLFLLMFNMGLEKKNMP